MVDLESDRFKNRNTEPVFRTERAAVRGEYAKNARARSGNRSNGFDPAFSRHTYKHGDGLWQTSRRCPSSTLTASSPPALLPAGELASSCGRRRRSAQVFQPAERHHGDWQRGHRPVEVPAELPQTAQSAQPTGQTRRGRILYGYRAAFSTASVDWAPT
jgi:hypothetical protein